MRVRVVRGGRLGALHLVAVAAAVTAGVAGPAHAADADASVQKQACISASERAQQLRMDGKLVEAQKQLVRYFAARPSSAERAAKVPWVLPFASDTVRGVAAGGTF